jgi:uncharacterized membrane protein
METRKTKKEIVKMLLKQDLEERDEAELLDLLIDNPIAVDVDKQADENKSFGDRCADLVAEKAGSWKFIIGFMLFLIIWIVINGILLIDAVDPFPFILLNLILSCIAALQAPIIMMSQNRQAKKDRDRSHNDYMTDLKSELILEELHIQINTVLKNQARILHYIDDQEQQKVE